ncbi:MAG: tRNA pseudouridine(38-40) synthase TruA [Sulfurovum sp.]|nr:tRNA pseudouridine(38-40) synthase TruA [Sulfurovum sp.]MCB4753273.1 tRNA pseudouridine(38-40) synthase TruA [Sulfurovum sp.]MCB4758486.1 tRNA pseudouridine(38-40) synthase TruA [Sulfurovum sp.]MCB4763142.1 tRNA pseudouridine(38-40) synthase TruA [Sulfurovum sp.]MCB4779026.1 tRNA pseudouridine(38-40) synthase TruA [Sulfurovum sp.]
MRVKAIIAYDGSIFYGFQKQRTTPHTITHAIEKILKTLQINTTIIGSGRTDRGVHATGQVIHFDLPDFWEDLEKLRHLLNRKLKGIFFRKITIEKDHFHARFDAKKRLYRYLFKTSQPNVFERNYIAYYKKHFDICLLNSALKYFIGEHDFYYFHKTGSKVHTTRRILYQAGCYCYQGFYVIYFEANGFLRSQVRMMVDAAMMCAYGTLSLDALQAQINTTNRITTTLAPPQGLYLAKIKY